MGFRQATGEDAAVLTRRLEGQVFATERRQDWLPSATREHYRSLHVEPRGSPDIEPPSPDRLVRSALHRQKDMFCAALVGRLPSNTTSGLDTLLHMPESEGMDDNGDDANRALPPLLALRPGTDQASVQSLDEEADKFPRVSVPALPSDLRNLAAIIHQPAAAPC